MKILEKLRKIFELNNEEKKQEMKMMIEIITNQREIKEMGVNQSKILKEVEEIMKKKIEDLKLEEIKYSMDLTKCFEEINKDISTGLAVVEEK